MRRFSLYKRGKYFYARFWNPETGTYTGAISTRETKREAAIAAVYHWEHYGISKRNQSVDDVVAADTVLHHVRTAPLTVDSASRIIDILKDRELIESATLVSDGPDTEPLLHFLERFWDYDESPYVREKRAYNHSIGGGTAMSRRSVFTTGVPSLAQKLASGT